MKKMFLNLVVVLSLVALSLVSCENKTTNAAESNSEPVENTPADSNVQSTDSTVDTPSNPSSIDSTSQQSQKDSSAQSSN